MANQRFFIFRLSESTWMVGPWIRPGRYGTKQNAASYESAGEPWFDDVATEA